jgi:hypothetical protein
VCPNIFRVLFVVAPDGFPAEVLQGERLKRLGERQHLKEWIVLPKEVRSWTLGERWR